MLERLCSTPHRLQACAPGGGYIIRLVSHRFSVVRPFIKKASGSGLRAFPIACEVPCAGVAAFPISFRLSPPATDTHFFPSKGKR